MNRWSHLRPLIHERPIEEVAVIRDDDLGSQLGNVREEPSDNGLLVGFVEDVEWSRERGLWSVLEVLASETKRSFEHAIDSACWKDSNVTELKRTALQSNTIELALAEAYFWYGRGK